VVKTAGKIFFVFSLVHSFFVCANSSLALKVVSTDGIAIEQACAGQPFVIEVSVSEDLKDSGKPKVCGIEQFQINHTGFQMRMINGRSSVKYTYNVRVDMPGAYKIGPVEITKGDDTIYSNEITLAVADEQIEDEDADQKTKKADRAFFHLAADKKNVVIGEKILCSLRFYYVDGADLN